MILIVMVDGKKAWQDAWSIYLVFENVFEHVLQ